MYTYRIIIQKIYLQKIYKQIAIYHIEDTWNKWSNITQEIEYNIDNKHFESFYAELSIL